VAWWERRLVRYGALAGAIVALASAWTYFHLPEIRWAWIWENQAAMVEAREAHLSALERALGDDKVTYWGLIREGKAYTAKDQPIPDSLQREVAALQDRINDSTTRIDNLRKALAQ
jgi:hypothetical protein